MIINMLTFSSSSEEEYPGGRWWTFEATSIVYSQEE
jgi:hypothetical protein